MVKKITKVKKRSAAFESRNLAILILLIIVFILIVFLYFFLDMSSYELSSNSSADTIAIRIIDGDTFELESGQTVRLICIDTPEKNQKGYGEAKQFLSGLIFDKQLRLESDVEDKDSYGRLLRYVYVNISGKEIFVNREIIQQGYGTLFPYGNDTKKCPEIAEV